MLCGLQDLNSVTRDSEHRSSAAKLQSPNRWAASEFPGHILLSKDSLETLFSLAQ